MALTLGVAALFFGVVFIIVGFKGGDTNAMTANLVSMMEGKYPYGAGAAAAPITAPKSTGATASTGGTHAPAKK